VREFDESLGNLEQAYVERRSIRRQWECAMLLAGALAAASFAPRPLVMPIVSVLLVFSAGFVAGGAWLRSECRAQAAFTRWDQAGILMVAGFIAALTGDSADAVQFMESWLEPRMASE
jgi:hypothetical protein